jgi:DNA-binding transcriptional LysR family regulator
VRDPAPPTDDRRAVPPLRVGFVPGVTLTKWRRIWDERFPQLALDVVAVSEAEQRDALDQERVDLCFVRLPLAEEGLHVIPLYEEVPVVVTPRDHPVALFDEVTLAELSEEDALEGFEGAEAMDLVAGGAGVVFVPQSVARSFSRRDLVHRPVSDGVPTRVALAWLRDNPHEMIQEFIGIVRGRTVNSSRSPRPEPVTPAPERTKQPSRPARGAATRGGQAHRGAAKRPGRSRGR